MCLDYTGESVIVNIEQCRPPAGSALYRAATVKSVAGESVELSCDAGEQPAVTASQLLVPMSALVPSPQPVDGFCCIQRGTHTQRMQPVVISSSDGRSAVQDKYEKVPANRLAARRTPSDIRPGSEVLCKNSGGAYFSAVISDVGQDTCTVLKPVGEQVSVAFSRVLGHPDPELLQDGARVLWSADASCKSFRPVVIGSVTVKLEDLALLATRELLEVGSRVFYRQSEDASQEDHSTMKIAAIYDESADLIVEVAQDVAFDRLDSPLLPIDRESIAVDTKVRYQYSEDGSDFYPAKVTVVRENGTFDIVEDDNEKHDSVDIGRLFSHTGPLDQASLRKGSRVRYGYVRAAMVTEVKEDGEGISTRRL
ncbi:MAG: hypothetical protein CME01_10565 [Geminicoccus sp.]|nr:hypothetical protein [Geminicoccus sp.]